MIDIQSLVIRWYYSVSVLSVLLSPHMRCSNLARGETSTMLRPFHVIAEGTVLDSDICIIGTGPAGLTVARALERTGLRIVMIKSAARR